METNSIIYGAIIFLALVFGDLGVTGVVAVSGPLAALIIEIHALRKKREAEISDYPETSSHGSDDSETVRIYATTLLMPASQRQELVSS